MTLSALNRTLDQDLAALVRGVSFECLVCGEFVLHIRAGLACPECRSIVAEGSVLSEGWELPEFELPSVVQAG
ncbi:MAG: hypothetical protein OEW52_13670 [Thermoleophilia bacterium]|nr:hypothetical protein [Thermoleophilia bacterium]